MIPIKKFAAKATELATAGECLTLSTAVQPTSRQALFAENPTLAKWITPIVKFDFGANITVGATGNTLVANGAFSATELTSAGGGARHPMPVDMRLTRIAFNRSTNAEAHICDIQTENGFSITQVTIPAGAFFGFVDIPTPKDVLKGAVIVVEMSGIAAAFPTAFLIQVVGEFI